MAGTADETRRFHKSPTGDCRSGFVVCDVLVSQSPWAKSKQP
jgi:hypothetical protein